MRECLKFLIAGDRGVGKSTMIQRLCYDSFTGDHKQTVGLDLYRRSFQLNETIEVEIEIWDLAGDVLHSRMLRNYLKNVNAIMLMYDTTNRSTLQHLTEWYRRIVTELGPVNSVSSQPIKFVVVGGKTDVVRTRQVSLDDHKKTVEQLGAAAGYFCSSKMNEGVSSSFRYTAADLLGIDSKTVEDKTVFKAIVLTGDNRVVRSNNTDAAAVQNTQTDAAPRLIPEQSNRTCSIQ